MMAGMEACPSVDTVLGALDALYRQPDTEGKRKASLWLTELQSAVCSVSIFAAVIISCISVCDLCLHALNQLLPPSVEV